MVSNAKCGFLNEALQDDKIRNFKEKEKRKQEELEKERLKALELLMVEEQIDEEITENPNIVNHIIQELQTN
jgi:Spy/CpxP family protein refolding chaperone